MESDSVHSASCSIKARLVFSVGSADCGSRLKGGAYWATHCWIGFGIGRANLDSTHVGSPAQVT